MRSEGHCFRCNPYLFPCLACPLLCFPFEWIGSAAPPIEAEDAGLEPRFPYFNGKGGNCPSNSRFFGNGLSKQDALLTGFLFKYQIEETIR